MSRQRPQLSIENRESVGSAHARRTRHAGQIPAIIYGHGKVPRSCLLNAKAWSDLSHHGIHLVDLAGGNAPPVTALVKDVQFDYLSNRTLHVDFIEVNMDEVITAMVPVRARGTAAGQAQGGVLEQMIHELEVSCTPNDLPEFIEHDISPLNINDIVHIRELVLPPKVVAVGSPEQAVFRVTLPRIEEVAAPVVAEGAEVPVVGVEGEAVEGAEKADGAAPAAAAAAEPGKDKGKEKGKEKERK